MKPNGHTRITCFTTSRYFLTELPPVSRSCSLSRIFSRPETQGFVHFGSAINVGNGTDLFCSLGTIALPSFHSLEGGHGVRCATKPREIGELLPELSFEKSILNLEHLNAAWCWSARCGGVNGHVFPQLRLPGYTGQILKGWAYKTLTSC